MWKTNRVFGQIMIQKMFCFYFLWSLYDEFGRCEGKWMYIFVQTISSEDMLVTADMQEKK